VPPLPQVSFIDPDFGVLGGLAVENDEHPPTDIQRGQAFVSQVINAAQRPVLARLDYLFDLR
jgi:phosphoesterase family protein